MRQSEQHIIAK